MQRSEFAKITFAKTSGNNILEVDFTVIRAKPVNPSGPSESDNETPHHLIHEKVPINNSDPTGNVFRFYIWPSDVEPKTTSEDAAKEETIETDPTDGKMEDERNSNVFRFCRFFGVHNVVEAPTKLRPGTVYFGSVENLVPDKTDEEPSFKVKKEVGPNEPLDVFYFCKDPSLPRFPSGNNILEVDFTVIRAKPVDPSGPSESDNETPHHLIPEKVPINNSDPTGNVFRFYIWPSDVEPKTTSEDAAKEETIETDPTDGKMEDERNSNVFRFCRFFGVHNVVEAPTKLRPGTVYFGSVENLVPDKTDEEPSFKVKKEVGPNEPLDVFYFCKDPSLPRFPSGNNILEVDFTVIRAKPVNPSGPSESDNETPHHLIHEKVPINNSDPTGNVFRFYIWPSDVEPKTTSEDAAKEETIETDPTDGKMEDERNSNVFRFCRFFGVHNVVEAPTKLRPGTVYFGSVENLVPDKTDEEPSFKVKKEVGPNEPLDVFYFCKDPSLPRFPSGNIVDRNQQYS